MAKANKEDDSEILQSLLSNVYSENDEQMVDKFGGSPEKN